MGHKYALLILPVHSLSEPHEHQLDERTSVFLGEFRDLVGEESTAHWREWIGSLAWDTVEKGKSLFAITQAPSELPAVLDQQNQALSNRLGSIWEALAITRVVPVPTGEAWVFSGALERGGSSPRLRDIRSFGRQPEWINPFYCQQIEFWRTQPSPPTAWMQDWLVAESLLRRRPDNELPLLLRMAVQGFISARTRTEVEFRIADFVRVAETVLALPRGRPTGAPEFAKRALQLAHRLATDPFLADWDLAARLKELYNHRSACVHGKVPFEELLGADDEGKLVVAKFEYLAEHIARAALLIALQPGKRAAFSSRAGLETAWLGGAFLVD